MVGKVPLAPGQWLVVVEPFAGPLEPTVGENTIHKVGSVIFHRSMNIEQTSRQSKWNSYLTTRLCLPWPSCQRSYLLTRGRVQTF